MQIKVFDVVELKNNNLATILGQYRTEKGAKNRRV